MTHLNSFYLIVKNCLIFNAQVSMVLVFFQDDIAFKIFESHAEIYCIVGNYAGMRWLKLFICNNTMLLFYTNDFIKIKSCSGFSPV